MQVGLRRTLCAMATLQGSEQQMRLLKEHGQHMHWGGSPSFEDRPRGWLTWILPFSVAFFFSDHVPVANLPDVVTSKRWKAAS